ncbi:MAG TPA: L-seryl-tRNA(Sec) selenium transferase, partial [Rectinemataceae bacterium]
IVPERALEACVSVLRKAEARRLRKVLNATGVVLHTNLGRSPISRRAWAELEDLNSGYSTLEYDLASGKRGSRGGLVPELVAAFSGAESGLAVNNNAAAVLLCLSALAKGKEVLVSRGEAVQIGGGFRIPEILALSGARLVDVGTTNITTAEDYRSACGPTTALVLLVHCSNFAIRGFTAKPTVRELKSALPSGLPIVVDQGSGSSNEGLAGEEDLRHLLREGADLVCFSADKVLGGPQAGIIAGSARQIEKLSKHPMMRAFRPGKTILSLLESVLVERMAIHGGQDRLNGESVKKLGREAPTAVMAALGRVSGKGRDELEDLGKELLAGIPGGRATLEPSRAAIGGGSSPDESLDSLAIAIKPLYSAQELAAFMRSSDPPIIARVERRQVILDLLTLADEDPALILGSVIQALDAEAGSMRKAGG